MSIKLEDLITTLKKLRSPNGCDWDKAQTHKSLIPYLLEETYEVIEAIESKQFDLLKEELGDLLLHVIFQAELASESNKFNIYDSILNINNKLINRHPHIFSDKEDKSWKQGSWESAKKKEKNRDSILDGVPKALPSLIKARRIQEKASGVGFDWDNIKQVYAKVDEELVELKDEIKNKNQTNIEQELGDLLFSIVNLSRHIDVNPELALNQATQKFIKRFHKVESYLNERNLQLEDQSLSELDEIWSKIKLIKNSNSK